MEQPSLVTLPWKLEREAPPGDTNEIKYPESLVRYFLERYTTAGDRVFDPFTGLGTTLFVAEEMKCIPYGIEAERDRYEWVAGQLEHWTNLIHGDSADMLKYGFPKMDFSMTSPPYMPKHHKWNPLFNGDPKKAGYDVYLAQIAHIYKQLAKLMKKNAYVIVQVDNLPGRVYTPLVWDVGSAVAKVMKLEAEIMVAWKNAKEGYPHTHCLLFKNT